MRIEHLYVEYFNYPPNSAEAEDIKEEIISISICYNVLSPFTSFTGGGGGMTIIEFDELSFERKNQLNTYNYPEPFTNVTEIHLKVHSIYYGIATINIYDLFGRLIHVIEMHITGPGDYSASWNGTNSSGNTMPAGHYFYTISYGQKFEKGRMVKY